MAVGTWRFYNNLLCKVGVVSVSEYFRNKYFLREQMYEILPPTFIFALSCYLLMTFFQTQLIFEVIHLVTRESSPEEGGKATAPIVLPNRE